MHRINTCTEMLSVINYLMQKREKEQRRKLQQFLNDLALLGSLQVSERTSGVQWTILILFLNLLRLSGF